ncbi:MAG: HAD family hydrolase [Proteobacteria bacterium]|nr:HAD family hydrolase [Pseudomonadota bacterium]
MSRRLVIFDCDGVMFNSRRANEAFYNAIRRHFGLPPMDLGQIDYVHMATAEESVNYIIPDPALRAPAQAYRLTLDYRPFVRLMIMEPELRDVLAFLRPGIKTAVSTNRSNTIRPLLENFGLMDSFDMVVSSQDVTRPKPDPESVFLILDRLDVRPGDALFVGDSTTDADAAHGAGVELVAYRNPDLPAEYHIRALGQIKTIVGPG